MTAELLIAFIAFAFVTSVTPGPNNMMLLASGVIVLAVSSGLSR